MTETCIRRPTSLTTNCRCTDCRRWSARVAKAYRAGIYPRIPMDKVWAIVDDRIARGWTAAAIGSAAGISYRSVWDHLDHEKRTGKRSPWQHGNARALLNIGEPTIGRIGATGTTRRLQALAVMGHNLRVVAEMTGIPESSLSVIRSGRCARVEVRNASAVAGAYEQLSMTRGKSSPSFALSRGWVGPLSWDDDTIDDPASRPCGVRVRDLPWTVEDFEEFLRQGETHEAACRRLGATWKAVEQRLHRAGRNDLLPWAWAGRRIA